MEVLIHQDGEGHAAVVASLAALESNVKIAYPTKPLQRAADVITLYAHACVIKQAFDKVGGSTAHKLPTNM